MVKLFLFSINVAVDSILFYWLVPPSSMSVTSPVPPFNESSNSTPFNNRWSPSKEQPPTTVALPQTQDRGPFCPLLTYSEHSLGSVV